MSSADADDPPRSRLFVVCPKGTGQDTLQRAFEDLLAKLSADPPFAARGETTTPRKDPDEDALEDEHHDDEVDEDDVRDEPRDEPPLVKHLESVRVVPRKGVAFAKFSDAATAMRCMAAIADANGALGALRVKCMLAEPKASAGAGAGAAERANGTPPPPPPPPPGGAAAGGGPAAAGLGGGVAAGSRPRGERSGEPPGGSASPKRARRGGDGDDRYDDRYDGAPNNSRGGFPPPPHQTPVLGSESRRQHHRTSRTSPTSSAESGGGIGGRGIGRSPVQNPVPSPPPMPPGPPPGVFLGEAWMGDGRRGALVFHPRTGGVPTLGVPTLVHPATAAPPPPPHYPPPAFAHFPAGTAHHPHATVHASAPNATPNFIHHAHVPGVHPRPNAPPPPPPDWPPPSPAASARSGASSALSGGGGGGGGVTRGGGGGGGAGEVTTSADSDSVRSNGAAGHTRRAFVVLDKTVTQSHLESLFRDTCEGVITVELKTDGHSGKSRGFAYVTFESPAFVQAACERLNGRELPEGSGVRCKVMPALDREHRPTPERSNGSNKRRSNGHGNGNGRGGAGSAAGGASSGEGADRSTRTEAPSPSPESDLAKKKTRTMNEEKEEEEEEEEEDEDALSWQLPGPRKYSRLNSPSAGDEVEGSIPPGAGRSFDPDDDGAIHEEEEEQEEEEEDDDDEAESGVEAASSRRLVLRRDASRSKAEEEATDAAMALGKVSLGVVPEEDTTAVLAEGDRTRLLEGGTDAEPSDGTSPDDALDKFEGDGDDGPGGNRTRDLSDRDDDEPADAAGAGETTDRKPVNRRPGKSESEPVAGEVAGSIPPGAGRVLFFRLALPLPSYALRHVLASHGEVADLSMRPDGASGRVEYVDEEGADAALEALHATEILGIELRVSRLQADVAGKKAAAEGGGADQRKKRTRRA